MNKATLYVGRLASLTVADIVRLAESLMGRPATEAEVEEARRAFSERLDHDDWAESL